MQPQADKTNGLKVRWHPSPEWKNRIVRIQKERLLREMIEKMQKGKR